MIPLRIVESDREGFDEPVVEIWRADEFVGMVFWDEDVAVVQIYPDEDGDVFDLSLSELFRVLGVAEAIVTPEEYRRDEEEFEFRLHGRDEDYEYDDEGDEEGSGGDEDDDESEWDEEHPATLALVDEFDPQASHRSDTGEGFFGSDVAADFISRCDELDLAVVEMEGFDLEDGLLRSRTGHVLVVSLPGVDEWRLFRPAANALARDTLAEWEDPSSLVVAFVVEQPDGETFVA